MMKNPPLKELREDHPIKGGEIFSGATAGKIGVLIENRLHRVVLKVMDWHLKDFLRVAKLVLLI